MNSSERVSQWGDNDGRLHQVIGAEDIPRGNGQVTEVKGHSIPIFTVDSTFFALDNTCAHRGGPLGEGELESEVVTCPWHGWEYNVRTAISLTTPSASVKASEGTVDGKDVKVLVSRGDRRSVPWD
jgi:nitrite reductase/ring-hydroxylating ferredoxin subunit